MIRKLIEFFLLLGATIGVTYYAPAVTKTPFYLLLLVAYYRSKNEAPWLVLFLTISDGFWGFFNAYEVVVSLIPGLPPVEIGHLYILLAAVKATKKPDPGPFFHNTYLKFIAVYIGFLVVQGYFMGLSSQMNVQFRLVKFLVPLTMFYSMPRLFQKEEEFRDCFIYIFPMAFLALFAQVFTITTGHTPSQMLGVYKKFWFTVDVAKGKTYRGFYSSATVLTAYFGTFYYLAKRDKFFHYLYLFAVMAACLLCVILSATRGWLVGFSLGLVLFLFFVLKISGKRLATVGLALAGSITVLMFVPIIEKQLNNAVRRFFTLEKLAGGDVTAGGTLSRISERSPRVMDKWSETPLTGWGFSDTFFKYADFHVGNQTILLHAGILGAIIMAFFFIYYHGTLLARSLQLARGHPLKEALLTFVIFFPGWFFIHSSSGQHFSFYSDPCSGIVLPLYFTLGAFTYKISISPRKTPGYSPPLPVDQPEPSSVSPV